MASGLMVGRVDADRGGVDDLMLTFVTESLEALELVERRVAVEGIHDGVRAEMLRVVHSIKGAAGMFGMRGLQGIAHGGEAMLCAGLGAGSLLAELRVALRDCSWAEGVRSVSFAEALATLVAEVARESGRMVRLEIVGDAEGVVVSGVRDAVVHAVRNAVVHGIEEPAARLAVGKPAGGLVRVRVLRDGGWRVVEVADDGAGVNVGRVVAAAVGRGLVAGKKAAELGVEMMFVAGISTADRVTMNAGRGVGLDAVRSQVMGLGGVVEVDSVEGMGSVFRMRLPLRAPEWVAEAKGVFSCGR